MRQGRHCTLWHFLFFLKLNYDILGGHHDVFGRWFVLMYLLLPYGTVANGAVMSFIHCSLKKLFSFQSGRKHILMDLSIYVRLVVSMLDQ